MTTAADFAQILNLEHQYKIEDRALRTEHMNANQSPEAHAGRVAATARAHDAFFAAFMALTDDEALAYGEYRKNH
jgi:hypothetical protein